MKLPCVAAVACMMCWATGVGAQDASIPIAAGSTPGEISDPPAPPPAAQGALLAGTPVSIHLGQAISSKTAKRGDRFPIVLDQPLATAEGILVPAGSLGQGEVVSAAPAKYTGQPGELVLAARYIEFQGRRIALRGMKLTLAGRDTTTRNNLCLAAFTLCVKGSTDVDLPAGYVAQAKLAEDLSLPIVGPPMPIPPVLQAPSDELP